MIFIKSLSQLSRCSALIRNKKLEPLGIYGNQYLYIIHVCKKPGINQDNLAKNIYVNKSNVARQVAALVDDGFFTREQSEEDKRVTYIYPTQKAFDALEVINKVLEEINETLLCDFTEEQRVKLSEMMDKILERSKNELKEK